LEFLVVQELKIPIFDKNFPKLLTFCRALPELLISIVAEIAHIWSIVITEIAQLFSIFSLIRVLSLDTIIIILSILYYYKTDYIFLRYYINL
jgi:hypothetical protein